MTVVELSPGGGWYQEIIGPYLRKMENISALPGDPESKNERTRDRYSKERDKLNGKKLYGDVLMVPINAAVYGEENSADLVVSFRNYHNWSGNSEFEKLRAIYKTLKQVSIGNY